MRRPLPPPLLLVLALAAGSVTAGSLASGCVRNPVTGKRELSLVSEAQEVQLGQQARQQVVETVGLYDDPALQAYVAQVGQKLAQASQRPTLPWSFQVVDDAAVNAFALPGGPILLTRGILAFMGSEAELAAVLGHEVGHVAARHSAQQLTRAQLSQVGLGLGAILLGEQRLGLAQLAGVGLQLLLLRHSRDAERQADTLGLQYLVGTGYTPEAMAGLFRMLSRATAGEEQGRLPGWLATHPSPEERLREVLERLRALPPAPGAVEARDAYLARLDGLVYGSDPRQGFFRGQTFLHPTLRIQLTFPEGFQAQNQPHAVVGVGPRQQAALVLALAAQGSPLAAAQAFARQPTVQVAAVGQGALNGQPAVTARFVARSEQGLLEGMATFIASGGRTFQLLGFAPAGALVRVLPALDRALASFGPLTDPEALAARPARLEVVTLPSAMTLTQFADRFPSTLPLEEVARLNGVEPSQVLEAGRRVKRVVGGPALPQTTSARQGSAGPGRG